MLGKSNICSFDPERFTSYDKMIRFINELKLCLVLMIAVIMPSSVHAQQASISGNITSDHQAIELATFYLKGTSYGATTDTTGKYVLKNIPAGKYKAEISAIGYIKTVRDITLKEGERLSLNIDLIRDERAMNEVVITGTLKEVIRSESPVPVEVYTTAFLKKNPAPNIFEALANVNGVRPQLNCNVCNTGDIHINGLEGPYTMVLIDGMPIVSALSTVYGLMGIPSSMIERVEIVKGPASSLYGSEAVGGLINIITKRPQYAPLVSFDAMTTSWLETNIDLGVKLKVGKKTDVLTGVNLFYYDNIQDNNNDNFTDVPVQKRISVFQKWNFERKDNRLFSLAARYLHENRWGGDVRWTPEFRGGDSLYGESIYTNRIELIGQYQLPVKEKVMLSFSFNQHLQDSYYGSTPYNASQRIAFAQLTWDKQLGNHDLLLGTAGRYTFYDDNTMATSIIESGMMKNFPSRIWLPGVFVQDEIALAKKHKLLLGYRYDYNSYHGNIHTPRVAYKWSINDDNIIRLNAGTGFRVVNLFTEDHAALTGAREVVVLNELKPEHSWNTNLNFLKKIYMEKGFLGIDASVFYTHFSNKILPDYDTDANKIIYDNLDGYAESKGISLNIDYTSTFGLKLMTGATLMDVSIHAEGREERQMLTEHVTGTWGVSYEFKRTKLTVDYTGNVYSPMRLPLLGELDPRAEYSPWWSIQNIQLTYKGFKNFEIYGGVKNLLNWTPNKGNPFIIARSFDPFDKQVQYDSNGYVLPTEQNPYALTFDPTYVYGPNQGIRGFVGVRYTIQ